MKPIIIYTMPRTRGTAALESCILPNKMFEPFSVFKLLDIPYYDKSLNTKETLERAQKIYFEISQLYPSYVKNIKKEHLDNIFIKLNDNLTVSKLISIDLFEFLPARTWFENADKNQTHDIVVLIRDRREMFLSYILANYFGFFKRAEIEPYEVTVTNDIIFKLKFTIDCFLRFFPKNCKVYNFYNLPKDKFNISATPVENQVSLEKIKYIKNIDFVEEQIKDVIDYYNDLWQEKVQQ